MKIIGETANGFILTADKNELRTLCGYYYEGNDGAPVLTVGAEILVNVMYRYLYNIKHAETALRGAASVLRHVADLAELVCPIFTPKEEK